MEHHSLDLLGYEPARNIFPLLVKILDATKRLSLQVHPDDHSAALHGGEAKSEMWYILDANPGACVFAGLAAGMDESGFRAALDSGNEEAAVLRLDVHAGDVVNVPGGRVHAIEEGCLILEVQQNSNTTYRVSDWGRVDPEGNPREMHLEQALRVMDWSDHAANLSVAEPLSADGENRQWALLTTPYFSVERFELEQAQSLDTSQRRFRILFNIKGKLVLAYENGELALPPGRSVLIPASCESLRLIPDDDVVEIVSIRA
jgi:mannose-6-phosphate isomerase